MYILILWPSIELYVHIYVRRAYYNEKKVFPEVMRQLWKCCVCFFSCFHNHFCCWRYSLLGSMLAPSRHTHRTEQWTWRMFLQYVLWAVEMILFRNPCYYFWIEWRIEWFSGRVVLLFVCLFVYWNYFHQEMNLLQLFIPHNVVIIELAAAWESILQPAERFSLTDTGHSWMEREKKAITLTLRSLSSSLVTIILVLVHLQVAISLLPIVRVAFCWMEWAAAKLRKQ